MTRRAEMIVEDLSPFQAKVLNIVGKLLRIPGTAFVGFLEYEIKDLPEPTINDIVKQIQEDEMNSVRQTTTNRMESGE